MSSDRTSDDRSITGSLRTHIRIHRIVPTGGRINGCDRCVYLDVHDLDHELVADAGTE